MAAAGSSPHDAPTERAGQPIDSPSPQLSGESLASPLASGLSMISLLRPAAAFRALGLLAAVCLGMLPLAACSSDDRLIAHTATGDYVFTVEVVDTPEARAKGLMFRQSLAKDAGMLFDFKQEQQTAFWMQNTFIPLDMVFIAADGEV